MEYTDDLLSYYENLGDKKPEDILADDEFTKRALSEVSPPALVRTVAKKLTPEALNEIVETLSTFERARVFGVLGRTEEALELYWDILLNSKDKHIRGRTFMILGMMKADEEGFEECFKEAIKEGYISAYADWALSLEKLGRIEEAIDIARMGFHWKDARSAYVLISLLNEKKNVNLEECRKLESQHEAEKPGFLGSLLQAVKSPTPPHPIFALRDDLEADINRIIRLCIADGIDFEKGMREVMASALAKDGSNLASRVAFAGRQAAISDADDLGGLEED